MKYLLIILALCAIAACDNVPPSPTPARVLSGPTLEPSPTILPFMQAQEPTQLLYQGQNDPTAAALPRDSELPPLAAGTMVPGQTHQPITVTAPDGTQLIGDLYVSPTQALSPGILMIAPDSKAWLDLPLQLQNKGYTVLAMPLRADQVVNSTEALGDFEAMIQALSQVGDPGHLAVIGAESGADLALAGCAADTLCKALVLLTPTNQEIAQLGITRYNPRPLFLAVAQNDSANFGISEYLRGSAQGGEVGYDSVDGSAKGAALLQASPALGDQLIEWIGKQLNT
ncbi:MAG: hypothetical protein ABI700_13875 [Chloroflexota bacterium]